MDFAPGPTREENEMEQQPDALLSFLPLAVLILLFWIFSRTRKNGVTASSPTLVLKALNIFSEGKDGTYINIIGRPAGMISWLLTALGLETTTTLVLTSDRLTYSGASFRGEHYTVLPLPSIESTSCGYSKPIGWVVAGVLAIIIGLVFDRPDVQAESIIRIVAIVLGALFIIKYFFSKKMYMAVSAGQTTVSISFKKSVIENVPVTLERTKEAISVLNTKSVASQMKS